MKLSLQLILETLTEYGAQLIETDGDFAFTGVQILTSPTDILEPDTLYVCTPKVLPRLKKQLFENHCFVFKAKPSQLQCHHALHGILLDENTDLNEVVNRLITLFTQFHAFEFAIKEASLERRGLLLHRLLFSRCAADAARHLALHLPDAGAGKLL